MAKPKHKSNIISHKLKQIPTLSQLLKPQKWNIYIDWGETYFK